jgi:hypothetical protein
MNTHIRFGEHGRAVAAGLLLGAGLAAPLPASALQFGTDEIHGTLSSTLSAGVGLRMQNPDPQLVGIANGGQGYSTNGDDGNLAFDKHDLYATATKLTSDLTLTYRDFGVFVRGTYLYDVTLNSKNGFFDRGDFAGPPTRTQGPADFRRRTSRVQDELGDGGDILDAYFFGSTDLGGRSLSYKIGRQNIQWGESTFILNGINSLVAFNANRFHTPGYSLTEVENPAETLWAGVDLADNVNLEAFYQWKWRETVTDATGSFFSTNDFVATGGERVEIGFGRCPENSAPLTCAFASGGSAAPRHADNTPSNGGQYGAALNLILPQLSEMGLSLYAANYHSRLPVVSGNAVTTPGVPGTASYTVEYPEDIKLYGISFNAGLPDDVLGGIALQGEYSLKQDQPLQIEDVEILLAALRVGAPNQIDAMDGRPRNPGEFIRGYIRRDVSQFDLSATKIIGPIPAIRSDQLLLLGEVGLTHVHNMPDENTLRLEGPGTYTPANAAVAAGSGVPQQTDGYPTANSWGYRLMGRLTYNNVFGRVNLTPTLYFAHDVKGTSPTPILNFVEGRKQVTASMGIAFRQAWDVEVGYTNYFGGGNFNLLNDRDFLSLAVKYSF